MNESESFVKNREERFKGKIRFMTYARYLGEASSHDLLNRGGILFLIGDTLHFEDFESTSGLKSIVNWKEDYVKREFSIDLEAISIIKEVIEKNAKDCIHGLLDENSLKPPLSGFLSIFSSSVIQIFSEGRVSMFFDFFKKRAFIEIINEFMLKSE